MIYANSWLFLKFLIASIFLAISILKPPSSINMPVEIAEIDPPISAAVKLPVAAAYICFASNNVDKDDVIRSKPCFLEVCLYASNLLFISSSIYVIGFPW